MGDGIHDAKIFDYVCYSIAPNNAFYIAKNKADYVTNAKSGEGAVAEACLHILEKFFDEKFDVHSLNLEKGSGAWKK